MHNLNKRRKENVTRDVIRIRGRRKKKGEATNSTLRKRGKKKFIILVWHIIFVTTK
jgi:hypothetical protein